MLDGVANPTARSELTELAAKIGGSTDIQRPLRLAAQQVNPWLSVKSLWLQTAPNDKPAEVALAEHEVVLLHFINQLTASLSQSQRCPTILNRLEARRESIGGTIKVGCFHRITKNLVERNFGKFVFRRPPGDFGCK